LINGANHHEHSVSSTAYHSVWHDLS